MSAVVLLIGIMLLTGCAHRPMAPVRRQPSMLINRLPVDNFQPRPPRLVIIER